VLVELFNCTVHGPPGLCVEEEPPNYDMDTEDEEWLNAQSRDRVSDISS